MLACRILLNEGVSEAAFNVSVRLSGDRWMTMPVTSPTLVTVDNLKIGPIAAGSTHWAAHPAIYKVRPDVNAIVHVHPPYAIAFGVLGEEFRPIHHYGTPFLGRIVRRRLARPDRIGRTRCAAGRKARQRAAPPSAGARHHRGRQGFEEAVLFTLYFEEACKIYAVARQMGGTPKCLTPAVREDFRPDPQAALAGQRLGPLCRQADLATSKGVTRSHRWPRGFRRPEEGVGRFKGVRRGGRGQDQRVARSHHDEIRIGQREAGRQLGKLDHAAGGTAV